LIFIFDAKGAAIQEATVIGVVCRQQWRIDGLTVATMVSNFSLMSTKHMTSTANVLVSISVMLFSVLFCFVETV